MQVRLLIFTDLDGTLLDHESYDFGPARPMLERLAGMQVPVILASSKTAAEISEWQQRLGLTHWPAIVENGAAVHDGRFDDTAYLRLRAALAGTAAPFRGFGDMTDAETADVTGLPIDEARLARRRAYSEPGVWTGSEAGLDAFLDALAAQGISARRGGRFLTLSYGGTKAGRMAEISARFRPDVTIALGDAPNDAEMIAGADRGIIIRNDHGPGLPPLPGEAEGRILRTQAAGPAGWTEGLTRVLRDLGLEEREDPDG